MDAETNSMQQQLAAIRRSRHIEHKKKVWFPQFLEKWNSINSPRRVSVIKIQRFLRKYYFKTPINMSEEELKVIPGMFRIRFNITSNNLTKLENSDTNKAQSNSHDHSQFYNQSQSYPKMFNRLPNQFSNMYSGLPRSYPNYNSSLNNQNRNEQNNEQNNEQDNELSKAIYQSMIENYSEDNKDNNDDLIIDTHDYELNKIIMESLKDQNIPDNQTGLFDMEMDYKTINQVVDPLVDPTVDPLVDPTIDPTIDPTVDPTVDPIVDPLIDPIVDSDIAQVMEESKKEFDKSFESILDKTINESLGLENNKPKKEEEDEDYLMSQAIAESLKNDVNNIPVDDGGDDIFKINDDNKFENIMDVEYANSITFENEAGFYVVLDLRVYGPDPYSPIYIGDTPYYLNGLQQDIILRNWNKINPDTTAGLLYKQNLDYQTCMANDKFKK